MKTYYIYDDVNNYLFVSPDGVIASVTRNGEFMGYWKPGFHWCLPWTEA